MTLKTGLDRRCFLASALSALFALAGGAPAWAAPRSLAELGRRFRQLRQRQKAAKPGTFDRATDGYGGELHDVMIELGKRLGAAGTKGTQVISIMGEPDEKKPERWVYLWRGWQDYLFFEMSRGRVVRADWYMALD